MVCIFYIKMVSKRPATTGSSLHGRLQSRLQSRLQGRQSNSFIDILKDSFIKKDQLPINMDLILRPSNCVVQ